MNRFVCLSLVNFELQLRHDEKFNVSNLVVLFFRVVKLTCDMSHDIRRPFYYTQCDNFQQIRWENLTFEKGEFFTRIQTSFFTVNWWLRMFVLIFWIDFPRKLNQNKSLSSGANLEINENKKLKNRKSNSNSIFLTEEVVMILWIEFPVKIK